MNEGYLENPKEIIKVFQGLKSSNHDIEVEFDGKKTHATLADVTQFSLILILEKELQNRIETKEISITVFHQNNIYFSICNVLDISKKEINISIPENLKVGVKRKYKRVPITGDIRVDFLIKSLGGKSAKSNEFDKIPIGLQPIYNELNQQLPDIKVIIPLISKELKKITPDFEIKFYKENSNVNFIENLMITYKETLMITNVKDNKSYLRTFINLPIMSYNLYFKHKLTQMSDDVKVKEEIIMIMKSDQLKKLMSYIFSPIMLFNDVIGHIYVGVKEPTFKNFREQDVFYIKSLCDIISEAFAKARLGQLDQAEKISAPIRNLSAGGFLMEINDPYILKFLTKDTKLDLELTIPSMDEVSATGKVVRCDHHDKLTYVAVKFLELKWKQQEMIDRYVSMKLASMPHMA